MRHVELPKLWNLYIEIPVTALLLQVAGHFKSLYKELVNTTLLWQASK